MVKGKQLAESTLQKLEACQASSDHYEGWRYLIDKSDLKPGTDPYPAAPKGIGNTGIESNAGNEVLGHPSGELAIDASEVVATTNAQRLPFASSPRSLLEPDARQ